MDKTDGYAIVSMASVLIENENLNYGNGSDRTYPKSVCIQRKGCIPDALFR